MSSTQSKSAPIVVPVADWKPNQLRFMPPKVNAQGGKSISLISTQSNRSLHIATPSLNTWGISDFVDPNTGISDGKFQISLSFPNDTYATKSTEMFLQKMEQFEQAIIDAAVQNSELWWGEPLEQSILKHTLFPVLKYAKIKGTKKIDTTKKPNINAKVPFYENENKWNVEIYDTKGELLFPNVNEELTPSHFVPKLSTVACVLQCGGIWIGGKGWGVTWKLVQAVVKPKITDSVFGKCHIQLTDEDQSAIENNDIAEDGDEMSTPVPSNAKVGGAAPAPSVNTQVDDSDEEEEAPAPAPTPVKKVIALPSEAPKVVAAPVVVETPKEVAAPAAVKKVVKKVAPK
jgi:hypothetical protein